MDSTKLITVIIIQSLSSQTDALCDLFQFPNFLSDLISVASKPFGGIPSTPAQATQNPVPPNNDTSTNGNNPVVSPSGTNHSTDPNQANGPLGGLPVTSQLPSSKSKDGSCETLAASIQDLAATGTKQILSLFSTPWHF